MQSKKKKIRSIFADISKIQRNLQKSLRPKFSKVKENKFTQKKSCFYMMTSELTETKIINTISTAAAPKKMES